MPLYLPKRTLNQLDAAVAGAQTQPLIDAVTQQYEQAVNPQPAPVEQPPDEPTWSLPSLDSLGVSLPSPSGVMAAIGGIPERAQQAADTAASWVLPSLEALGVSGPSYTGDASRRESEAPVPAPDSAGVPPVSVDGSPAGLPSAPSSQPAPQAVAPSPPTGGGLRSHAEAMAQKYGLPWDVFDRQLNQESGYRTDAVSSAGASGPGQFMPDTGNAVARQMGVTPAQFWASPELQVEGAALHMRDLLKANGGDIRMALAAYNAGQGNVDKYGEGVFDDDFAAGQTRDYVNIILGPGASQRRGRVSMNAGAQPAPAASPSSEPPAGGPEPADGRGSPAPDTTALWSPDEPAAPQAAFQMGTGRNAGGVMLRGPLQQAPAEIGTGETPQPVMGPGDGGFAPEPPAIDPAEGGVRSPAAATVMPVEEMEQAPEPLGPTVPDDVLVPPPSPYDPVQQASMEPAPDRFEAAPSLSPLVGQPGEPDYAPPSPPSTVTDQAIQWGQQNARPIADAVVSAAEALPGPGPGVPNPVSVVRAIFENTQPAAGAPRKLERLHQIRAKAAADQGRTDGRAMFSDDAVQNPEWAAANPALAAEHAQILYELSLDVGGMAGEAPRIGRVAGQVAETMAPTAPIGEAIQQGTEAVRGLGTRVTEGFREGRRVAAELNAQPQQGQTAFASLGPVPDPEVRIPRAGYATNLSEGAEQMVRQASDANAPQETVSRAEVARKAQEIIGADPDMAQRWQNEALGEAPDTRAVRGEALRQAEYIDAENANRALDRLREAQRIAREAGDPTSLAEGDKLDVADALIEAAETARAFQRSAAASTAEGRATARALAQRRSAILSRQAFQNAARARAVGQDAAFAAQAVQRAARTGTLTDDAAARLRVVRDKLAEADRHGLGVDDGAAGRLDALEQRTAAAQAPMQQARTAAARAGQGLGTRIATEVGTGIAGSTAGVTTGLATGQIEDQDDLRAWAAGGAAAALGARHLARRSRGTLATFGHVPTPEVPNRAVAIGADPSRRYEFRYRVADLSDLIPSNLPTGAPNPRFPAELQPRARERAASQLQIDRIAQSLDPDVLLNDFGRLDAGPMIVGADNIVESGNGRVLALRRAAEQHPERYQAYIETLRRDLADYGLTARDVEGVQRPVLVRERVTPVDRVAFTAEANGAAGLGMSPVEQAVQSASKLSDEVVAGLTIGDADTIATALRRADNRDVVRQWLSGVPENERAALLDEKGEISPQAFDALASAMLVRTYGQGAGTRAFIEAVDPDVRNVQVAIMGSLPDVARAEALIRSGQRDASLSLAGDVAAATEVLARLKRDRMSVGDYIRQAAMGDRELSPFQEQVLQFLDQNQRRPSAVRQALREYAGVVENAGDPNQTDMFGGAVASISKDDAWRSATSGVHRERQARVAASQSRLAAENAARTPASDIVPATGGPAGTLNVEGLPAVAGGVDRPPALTGDLAPVGGPDGTLRQQRVGDRSVPAGAAIDAPATGGPEGALTPGTAAPIADLARDARTWMQRALGDTNNGALDAEFRSAVDALANHSPRGRKAALDLLARHDASMAEQSTKLLGDVEKRLADDARRASRQQANEIEQSRIRGVVAQIDQVLSNPQAPGSVERLQQLHADLTEISQRGFTRSSEIRARLQRNGLLRAGMASKTEDVDGLVKALARVDPDDPGQMRAVLEIISKPRLIDKILEYQYVNMLSSPITQAVNISSNATQIAGRLFLQNPLEFVYSGGQSGGVRAGITGAVRGFREALPEAGEIMRTGVGRRDIDRAVEIGDYGHINREALTEQFGKAGELLHVLSTRPLQAMDALLGHTAYASAAEQLAQRKATQLVKSKAPSVQGMTTEQARQHVLANIWDYPEIVDQAGKIEEYTLLRSKDTEGQGWGKIERGLRQLAASRMPGVDAGVSEQMVAFLTNQIMPFFNVPLNFAKQGAERSVGAPINAVRAARAFGRGETERGAELAAKATIGAAALTTAGVLALGDNLTGDGPSDPGGRAVWEQTHKRNSFRVPGTDTWISWEGTPFAIPFGMVAGMKEGAGEALERSAKKGQTDVVDVAGSAAIKTVQGASSAFLSQSFVRGLADQYKLLTGQDVSMAGQAASAASTVSRFLPGSGMVNFLARVGDDFERDLGRPQTVSEMPENVAGRVGARIPGVRQQLDPRLGIYGEPVPNEQQGAAGILPYYRGAGAQAGDPITERLDAAGHGVSPPPATISVPNVTGSQIALTMEEQRLYQQVAGQGRRRRLEPVMNSGRFDRMSPAMQQKFLDDVERASRDEAATKVRASIGGAELRRRDLVNQQPAGVR